MDALRRRKEALRRLGSPRFRYECSYCRRLVPQLKRVHVLREGFRNPLNVSVRGEDFDPADVCAGCAGRIQEDNSRRIRDRTRAELQLERANAEHFDSTSRGSNPSYLEACERMKREMGL